MLVGRRTGGLAQACIGRLSALSAVDGLVSALVRVADVLPAFRPASAERQPCTLQDSHRAAQGHEVAANIRAEARWAR